jgi:hypothetical protein
MAILREGPWRIYQSPETCGDDASAIDTFVGDAHEYELEARAGDGTVLDITGYTLGGKVYNASTGAVLLNAETITAAYAAGGRVTWTPSTAWATAGTYRLTISLTAAGEAIILGPLDIKVRAR